MRRVLFPPTMEVPDTLVRSEEMGTSPIALVVEFIPRNWWGTYKLAAMVKVRDQATLDLISKNEEVAEAVLFEHQDVEAVEKRIEDVKGKLQDRCEQDGPAVGFNPLTLWYVGKFLCLEFDKARTVKITLQSLLDGVVVHSEQMERLSWMARELSGAVDKINGKIMDSNSDVVRTIANMAPGTKVTLAVWRKGKVIDVPATVGAAPDEKKSTKTADKKDSKKDKEAKPNRMIGDDEMPEALN